MIGMLFRAIMSRLRDGEAVQTVTVKGYDPVDRDGVERMQDYGFAAAPSEGEGLVIEVDGHMFVLRMDQVEGRPDLKTNEVAVWHREGHNITLRSGKIIDVECDDYNIRAKRVSISATESVALNTPLAKASSHLESQTLKVEKSGNIDGVDVGSHGHDKIQPGNGVSGGPVNRE